MNDRGRKMCSFCLETLSKREWNNIEETTKQMLSMLLLKPKLNVSEDNVMCKECASKLQNAVNFKSTCLDPRNAHLKSEENAKLTLEGEKLNANASIELNVVSGDHTICRFCKKIREHECYSYLHEKKENIFIEDMVQMYVPELHSSVIKELMTCKNCLDLLQSLLNFIMTYSDIDHKDNDQIDVKVKLEPDQMQESILEEEVIINEIKIEENCIENDVAVKDAVEEEYLIDMDNVQLNVKRDETEFKSEEYHNERYQGYTNENETIWQILYKCIMCTYKTKCKANLRRHMVIHKNPVEMNMPRCEICIFETKRKVSLTRHMVMHQNPSAFKCQICSLSLGNQINLVQHMLIHQSPSEVEMYHCDTCLYETRYKNCIIRHMLIHQSSPEVKIYHCEKCSFKTKYSGNLKQHRQTHETSPEIKKHKCQKCSYETRLRSSLVRHIQRKHIENESKKRPQRIKQRKN